MKWIKTISTVSQHILSQDPRGWNDLDTNLGISSQNACFSNDYTGKLVFETHGSQESIKNCIQSNLNVSDNQWHFVSITVSETSYTIYVDDNVHQENGKSEAGLFGANIALTIGKHSIADRNYFNGVLDDIRIYNRALSESEIQALYNEGN